MTNALMAVKNALKGSMSAIRDAGSKATNKASETVEALEKEGKFGPALHEQVLGAIAVMKNHDKAVEETLEKAYGYAVLPNVSKANLVLGMAYGIGEVFERGRVSGYCALVEFTLGVQVGGETFDAIIAFPDADTFKNFKHGKWGFAANAAAAILKAKAEATHGFGNGTTIFVMSEGGLQIVASLGVQKFIFKPAGLGRLRSDDKHTSAGRIKGKPSEAEEPVEASAEEEEQEEPVEASAEEEDQEKEPIEASAEEEEQEEPVEASAEQEKEKAKPRERVAPRVESVRKRLHEPRHHPNPRH